MVREYRTNLMDGVAGGVFSGESGRSQTARHTVMNGHSATLQYRAFGGVSTSAGLPRLLRYWRWKGLARCFRRCTSAIIHQAWWGTFFNERHRAASQHGRNSMITRQRATAQLAEVTDDDLLALVASHSGKDAQWRFSRPGDYLQQRSGGRRRAAGTSSTRYAPPGPFVWCKHRLPSKK